MPFGGVDSWGSKKPRIRWRPTFLQGDGEFGGGGGNAISQSREACALTSSQRTKSQLATKVYKRSKISIRGQIVAKKFTDEENRTARKSHCCIIERQQCIADTVVRRRDGPRRLSDHDECIACVGQQFMAPLSRTRSSEHR